MAPQLDQGSQRRPQAVFFFFLIYFPASRSLHAIVWGCLSSDTDGQRSLVHRSHPAPSPRCTVTMIHHSHGSLSLGPDTAVTHTHMHVNMQSCARGQTQTFIACSASQALVYLEITAFPKTSNSIWGFSSTNTLTPYSLEILVDSACRKRQYKPQIYGIFQTVNTCSMCFDPSGSILRSIGQQVTVMISAWHMIVVECNDLLEAAVYLIIFMVTKRWRKWCI